MTAERAFVEFNRLSTERIRAMAALSDDELRTPVGEHWTVAVVLAHLAFWDRRVLYVLDASEQEGCWVAPPIDTFVNDLSLPLWLAIPPHVAARIALETAETLDARLAACPPDLLEMARNYNIRYVERSRHRGEHLDEADEALRRRPKS